MDADLVVILGPTASGKTSAAVELALELGGEIISADSMQIYRGLDIGTAKPTPAERVVPFHGIDVVDVADDFTVVDFQALAERAEADIRSRGKVPILCGGTGFYIRAFLEGFSIPAMPADPEVRKRLQEEARETGAPALHRRLAEVDPVAAERIQPGDAFRIVRALEVHATSGKPITDLQSRAKNPRRSVKFGLHWERAELYRRIEERTDGMLAAGWMQETESLLSKGLTEGQLGTRALGYKHLAAHLRGELSLAEATELIKRNTRRYAKRQMTWFRREPDVCWIDAIQGVPAILERMLRLLHS